MKDQITYNGKKYKRVDESLDRRVTVKEVRSWLKKLEEFRYRKIRNVDARRVTSFINSLTFFSSLLILSSILEKYPLK